MKYKDDDTPKTRCFYSDNIHFFIDFYKTCNEWHIEGAAKREELLLNMIKEKKYKGCMVVDFNKTQDQVVEHFSKIHGNILNLSDKSKVEQFQKEVEASKMNMNRCPTCGREMILLGYGWSCYNKECSMNGVTLYSEPEETTWTDDIKPIDENEEETQ